MNPYLCPECEGKGVVPADDPDDSPWVCDECDGTGEIDNDKD